ncbi:hypothetical protein ACFYXM_11470 [Streptomyces sp. NPDC002476]|uniref:hypothetical protein n=1 Tax=Streptomyces sp. NPDC002476 TaxID=3364648 RepID=UPI00369F41CA
MTTDLSTDVRQLAMSLGNTVVASLWAHDDDLPAPLQRVQKGKGLPPVPVELRAPAVTSSAAVTVDDLVLIYDQRRRARPFDMLRHFTVREAIASGETVLARVTATTAATITVTQIQTPTPWRSLDLTAFGEAAPDARGWTLRPSIPNRHIGRLGSLADLRRRLAAHPSYPDWQESFTAAQRMKKTQAEARAEQWRQEQERQAPLRDATEHLQQLLGRGLIHWEPVAGRAVVARDLRAPGRLRTYVAGLRYTGAIDTRSYTGMQKQLALLGL